MKIYKHRIFSQWAKSENITNSMLILAVNEIKEGLYEANLGSGLYKKRLAVQGKGKSGGVRVIHLFVTTDYEVHLVDIFGKGEKSNLTKAERNELAKLAEILKGE